MRLLPLLLLTACTGPVVVQSSMEAQRITPERTKQLEHCWKTADQQVCWPVGTKPATWQLEYLEREGVPSFCKDDVCEPVRRQEV